MQRLGQHFLKNPSVLKKIVAALEIEAQDAIMEVGPGHGELTHQLVKARAILAIEKDSRLIEALKTRFSANPNIEICEGDALKLIPAIAGKKPFAGNIWKFAGNIPYYITGKLLRTLSELENKPVRTAIMVQREVAERMCAEPPDMNRLSASVQVWADAKIIMNVPKTDFSPAPKVDSTVVLLVTKPEAATMDLKRYFETVRIVFAQPRKTIANNLSAKTRKKSEIADSLKKIGLEPTMRPQDLNIKNIKDIANTII